ncbi:MAG: hypothetical protein AAB660_02265 [Patescibacteria group bacterium]
MSLDNPRIDKDEALIAAEAERSVRDLARETGVNPATKDIFDKRAEQRGEEALAVHREKKESLKGLVNPELREFREKLAEVNNQLEREFGTEYKTGIFTPTLQSWEFNDGTKDLKFIQINGLLMSTGDGHFEGVGPLGKKLETVAILWAKSLGGKLRGQDEPDQYVLDAYKHDPDVKALIDRFIELTREYRTQSRSISEVISEKKRLYGKAEGVNTFLERIGISQKIPSDFNPDEIKIYQFERDKDTGKIDDIARKIIWSFGVFDNLKITKEMERDFGDDLKILENKLGDIATSLRNVSDYAYSKEAKQAFVEALQSSETGRRYLVAIKSTMERGHFLYTVQG